MTLIDPDTRHAAGGEVDDKVDTEPGTEVGGPAAEHVDSRREVTARKAEPPRPPGDQSERWAAFRDGWLLTCTVVAMVAMVVAIVAWGYADRARDEAGHATAAPVATGGTRTMAVELGDFYIKPGNLSIAAGTHLVFKVTNKGAMTHDLSFNGKTTSMLSPGQSATLDVGQVTKSGMALCTVPGHAQAGMKMAVAVTGAAAGQSSSGPAATGGGMAGMMGATSTGAAPAATIDPSATPSAGWTARDPNLPPASAATVHNVTLHATERVLEVAPGVKQLMWTFNNTVPGPIWRGHVGDIFNVTLINDGKMGHSIDFHASETAMDVNMRTLQPGQSLTYTFKAAHAGIWMYHCGTKPALDHIGNGMYGAVIIDPPGLDRVDHEYALVQSELYLGAQGQVGDYDKMLSGRYDAVVFNGYYNQYAFAPIHVLPGQRLRFWVLDAGPNEISSFHVVGAQFDTVYKEGAYLLRPGPDEGGSQALDLTPAQGGFVEFTVSEQGTYSIVTHKFDDASRGGLGQIIAGTPAMAAGH